MSLSALPVFCSGFCIFLFLVLSHLIVFAQSLVMFSVFYSVFFSLLAPHKRHCSVYSLPVAEMTKLSFFFLYSDFLCIRNVRFYIGIFGETEGAW